MGLTQRGNMGLEGLWWKLIASAWCSWYNSRRRLQMSIPLSSAPLENSFNMIGMSHFTMFIVKLTPLWVFSPTLHCLDFHLFSIPPIGVRSFITYDMYGITYPCLIAC